MLRFLILALTVLAIVVTFASAAYADAVPGPVTERLAAKWGNLRDQLRLRLTLWRLTGDLGALYFRRGKSEVLLCVTVANPPTVANMTAGVPLSAGIAGMSGWETALNRIQQPVLKYLQDYQLAGPVQFGDAQIVMLDDDGTGSHADITERVAARTALAEGTIANIVISPKKALPITAGTLVHMFPIEIGSVNDGFTLDAESARYNVDFAINGVVVKNVAVIA